MPRFSDDELTRLKAIPLLDLCRDYGIELRQTGKDWKGRCPLPGHQDDSPSFVVTPGKNLWNCLGQCGCGGDTIALVMKKEGVSFRHACEKLRARLGAAPPAATITTRIGTSHDALATPEEANSDATLLGKVADFYHRTFCNEPAAMKYLQARACFHPEAVNAFRLGYANRTIGYRVPPVETVAGRELKARLQTLGVLRAETGHEHLNGCVVFPIHDAAGQVVQLYGRKLALKLPPHSPRHLYLAGPQRGVWNAAGVAPGADLFLCEALIDALTLWAHGWRNVTASYGVNGFGPDHWALIQERRPSRVVICYDADTAGHAKTEALAHELAAKGFAVWRAALPEGKDVNDVAREADDPATALRAILDGAKKLAGRSVAPAPEMPAASPLRGVDAAASSDASRAPASSLAALAAKKDAARERGNGHAEGVAPERSAGVSSGGHPLGAAANNAAAAAEIVVVKHDADEVVLACDDRTYRVRGLAKNTGFESLKISLRVSVGGSCRAEARQSEGGWHLDTLDLAQAKQRAAFVAAAADETGLKPDTLKRDLGRVLLKLEELQETRLRAQVAPAAEPPMPPELRERALALLRDARLWELIVEHAAACGIAGERTNVRVGYLGAVSRLLDRPLAIIIQSSSAAGKTTLMDAVLAFVPTSSRIKYSAMTGQALFYMGGADLAHKVLAIVEEEGAEKASYALKLLQSEHELRIAATGKNPTTGRMETQEYHVKGPTMIFLTTTSHDLDEELQNRCLILAVDESREQTERIHALQREARTEAGLARKAQRESLLALHRAAQTLLEPLPVFNPYGERLRFLSTHLRTRRDHEKYLLLIDTIALLFQHQRERRMIDGRAHIVATLEDIARANELAHEILGRGLDDLPPQTRRLLGLIQDMQRQRGAKAGPWRRRDLRAFTGWSDTALKVHVARLVDLEYVLTERDPAHLNGLLYALLFDGDVTATKLHLSGLIDVEELRKTDYGKNRSGQNEGRSAVGQPSVRGQSGVGPGAQTRDSSSENVPETRVDDENTQPGGHADAA
jgi:DNA primase catalytic core